MLRTIRSHFGLKIFISYLVVILVGGIVLVSAAEFAVPSAFERHLAAMSAMMAAMMGGVTQLEADLFVNFRSAVTEALGLAAFAAALAAIFASIFVSRQVVSPLRDMMSASQRIAEGHYEERVRVPGNPAKDELDELAQLALTFNLMAARLERTETMRRQLIGDVAHELRTPLAALKGYAEGLLDSVLPPDEDTFQQIYAEADRLERLVSDLQELSRVEARAFELNRKALSVSAVLNTAVSRLGRQFEEKDVALEVDVPEDLPQVYGDEYRLGQVLLNLMGNALQYTPPGGRVYVRASHHQREVFLSIKDTGIGVSAEHLPHLFDRFYRVDKSRSRAGGGSGIGLTIARQLVEAHGGRIWAESPGLGQGTTLTFTLPVAQP
jgi:histidine kinase